MVHLALTVFVFLLIAVAVFYVVVFGLASLIGVSDIVAKDFKKTSSGWEKVGLTLAGGSMLFLILHFILQ